METRTPSRVAYRVEIKVPLAKYNHYVEQMEKLGFGSFNHRVAPDKNPASSDINLLYLLSSEEKDKVLGFCIDEKIGSWCWPILVR